MAILPRTSRETFELPQFDIVGELDMVQFFAANVPPFSDEDVIVKYNLDFQVSPLASFSEWIAVSAGQTQIRGGRLLLSDGNFFSEEHFFDREFVRIRGLRTSYRSSQNTVDLIEGKPLLVINTDALGRGNVTKIFWEVPSGTALFLNINAIFYHFYEHSLYEITF